MVVWTPVRAGEQRESLGDPPGHSPPKAALERALDGRPGEGRALVHAEAGDASAGPPPLRLGPALEQQALVRDPAPLPSPDLSRVLLSPVFEDGKSVISVLDTQTGQVRRDQFPGRAVALTWLGNRSYVLLRALASQATLDLVDGRTGTSRTVDALPLAPRAEWAEEGGGAASLSPSCYGLWPGRNEAGAQVLVATIRSGDNQFELRRYPLDDRADPVGLYSPETEIVDEKPASARHRLLQVIPSPASKKLVLLWQDQPGHVPARLVDLKVPRRVAWEPPLVHPALRSNEDLSSCSFLPDERLLCHTRRREEQGFLFLSDTRNGGSFRVRQVTRDGKAAAYALSPDGKQVAYVGSGGADGPVVVQDLDTGASRQVALSPASCEGAGVPSRIFWLEEDRLLARGSCGAMRVVSLREGLPVAKKPPVEQRQGHTAGRRSSRRGPMSGSFWSPRY